MSNAEAAGPMAVMQMLQGAQVIGILTAALELNLFQKLVEGPLGALEVAERIGCPERSTRILFDALTVLGVIAKDAAKYGLTAVASDHLVPGKPMFLGDLRNIFASPMFWSALPRLGEAVKQGGTIGLHEVVRGRGPRQTRSARESGSACDVARRGEEVVTSPHPPRAARRARGPSPTGGGGREGGGAN
jgi:hypothetical protein